MQSGILLIYKLKHAIVKMWQKRRHKTSRVKNMPYYDEYVHKYVCLMSGNLNLEMLYRRP